MDRATAPLYARSRQGLGQNGPMGRYVIGIDDPECAEVRALLDKHVAFAKKHSPPEDMHALGVAGLLAENVSFFSLREDGVLLGVGALKQLDELHAEAKSMHTVKEARRCGVGRAMIDHLVEVARSRGCRRISLETGSMAAFAPARALFRSAGFETCAPFADYGPSPNSVFMTLELDPSEQRVHDPRAGPGSEF